MKNLNQNKPMLIAVSKFILVPNFNCSVANLFENSRKEFKRNQIPFICYKKMSVSQLEMVKNIVLTYIVRNSTLTCRESASNLLVHTVQTRGILVQHLYSSNIYSFNPALNTFS